MTPKEKANELTNKFYALRAWECMNVQDRKVAYGIAKQSAILCVEQIIKEVKDSENVTGSSFVKWERMHWEAVLKILTQQAITESPNQYNG